MTQLPQRQLGTSDIFITPAGIGTAPLASTPDWNIYWGPQDEREAIRAIQTAVDLGINWIDTAPFYGWGRGERIVGQAIQGRRDQVFIFTKCGTLRDEQRQWYESLKPASIRREVESSLRNLQIETIDLYQFHDPDPDTPIEESWATVQDLIAEGKVRYAGLSNHTVDLMERATAIAPITSNQHQYSLLYQKEANHVFPYSQQHNIAVLAWSPLASGFLVDDFALENLDADDFRHRHWLAHPERHDRLQEVRSKLLAIAHTHNRTLRELAIAWVLAHPAVTGAIIGIRNEQEARQIAAGLDWQLAETTKQAIEEVLEIWNQT